MPDPIADLLAAANAAVEEDGGAEQRAMTAEVVNILRATVGARQVADIANEIERLARRRKWRSVDIAAAMCGTLGVFAAAHSTPLPCAMAFGQTISECTAYKLRDGKASGA